MLKNLDGLARFAQEGVPGFHGPHIGKRVKKKLPGPSPNVCPGAYSAVASRVVLSGGTGGFQPAIGGRG